MSLINFSKANCKNCYKCLRSCPVKAIRFDNEQAEIVEERCISCGHCLVVCPQNARNIEGDLDKIKIALKCNKKVIASLAPSFIGAYPDAFPGQVITALKTLGFYSVEETAVGASLVSDMYKDYIENNAVENMITTCCPSSIYMIEKYYPSLTKYLIPVLSPMTVHGKLLKEYHGDDSFVVFIGPCVSKKYEALEYQNIGSVDAVLTFDELTHWFSESEITLQALEDSTFDRSAASNGRSFPMVGGILGGISDCLEKHNLNKLSVSGLEDCIDVFHSLSTGELNGVCVEVSACKGSCLGGPAMPKDDKGYYARQQKVKNYINSTKLETATNIKREVNSIDFSRVFSQKPIHREEANEAEIKKILKDMGKHSSTDELNCGVCGYNTCRAKAQAIYEGMANPDMCLAYMRSKAEGLSHVIFENTPNVILLIDEELKIKEMNPAAEEIFMLKANRVKDKPLSSIIDDSGFREVLLTGKDVIGRKVAYPQYNVVFIENIVYLRDQNLLLATMNNVIAEEKNKKELMRVKENTLNAAQAVIEKQMRVAQEIASLLGETTAETKIILTKLRKIVWGEDGEIK